MADFIADLQSFRPSLADLGIDPIMEPIDQFAEISQNTLENPTLNLQSFIPNFYSSGSSFSRQAPDFPGNWTENFQDIIHSSNQSILPDVQPIVTTRVESHESNCKKRKAMDLQESCSENSCSQVSEAVINGRNSSGRWRIAKGNEEKPKEVVHVRARRGQATNRHSLAERNRRGKIKEKLRCLQDIVPGCYKTTGMASMLDEIINYVKSLQNQVKFLSMELIAASKFNDFNLDGLQTLQRLKEPEAKEPEKLMRYGGDPSCFNSTWPV